MIVISGASGNLGRATALRVAELLNGGAAEGLALATRTPDALAGLVPGASVRLADFDRPDTLREAFAGAARLMLISTSRVDNRGKQHAEAIDAARDAGRSEERRVGKECRSR